MHSIMHSISINRSVNQSISQLINHGIQKGMSEWLSGPIRVSRSMRADPSGPSEREPRQEGRRWPIEIGRVPIRGAERKVSQHEGPSGRSRAEGAELKGGRAEGGRLKRASPRGPIRLGQCERGRSMGLIREGADPCG